MALTDQEYLQRLETRAKAARERQAKNERFVREGATICQTWADVAEGVALALEQRIYELKLRMQQNAA